MEHVEDGAGRYDSRPAGRESVRSDPARGELRIHLGAAPGVGKTYAALCEARRRRDRGTDVVVGLVETHGRARTADLLEGLEVLPRRTLVHRGTTLSELDVEAVLARAPEVVVVDELAHTNAPGSRHARRHEDVEEILAAGIDVISTVNVQHLESLHDVVERITGTRQQETVPDEVVRAAEQVELVDITPEALRRRLAHGNVYPAERIDASLAHYFRAGNLTALRELALLWVADQVDVALRRYRADEQIDEVWEARERVVVAVTGGPESLTVLRRAARIARRAGAADLLCVQVLRGDGVAVRDTGRGRDLRRLAKEVGASFHTVVGDDVAAALLDFARGANATQLVLGTSRRSRLARLVDPGIGARAVAAAGPIDVHLVSHVETAPAADGPGWWPRLGRLLRGRRAARGWPAAVVLPLLATGFGWSFPVVGLSTDTVAFFLATVLTAIIGGLVPAVVAALFGGMLLNYFFTPPLYTFTIGRFEDLVAVTTMLLIAVLVAAVVDRADRRAAQAAQARTEAQLLTSFARVVISRSDPLPRLLERVREAFGFTAVAVLERGATSTWSETARADAGGSDDAAADREGPFGGGPAGADADVEIDESSHLVGVGRTLTAAENRLFAAVAGPALLALRNRRISAQAVDATRRAEAGGLRTALLSAVGHDLRTPLAAIKAAVSSLRDPVLRLDPLDREELLATVEESGDRLVALVDNLLDSSRLATGAITPHRTTVGVAEIVDAAVAALPTPEARDRVEIAPVPPGEPDEVVADPGLAERIVANLIDNAVRHGGDGPVVLRTSAHDDRVELRVVDRGPGVARDTELFTAFQHLGDHDSHGASAGLGLGLHVAHGFARAMGGSLDPEETPGGGLTMVLSLPRAAVPIPVAVP